MVRGFILGLLLVIAFAAMGQKPKAKDAPTSLQPNNNSKVYAPARKKKKSSTVTYDARDDYNERTDALLKERLKRDASGSKLKEDERMKPPYFGHKRPPKVRPIEKRKYCKVCGIRH
ncbi:MAG: hypothetical protein JNK10_12930 [Cyclobacteriaceae bacterium]|nr:hypothetical protein [Cyclobacteriaceae bacterium]